MSLIVGQSTINYKNLDYEIETAINTRSVSIAFLRSTIRISITRLKPYLDVHHGLFAMAINYKNLDYEIETLVAIHLAYVEVLRSTIRISITRLKPNTVEGVMLSRSADQL